MIKNYYGVIRDELIVVVTKVEAYEVILFVVQDRKQADILAFQANVYSKFTKQCIIVENEKLITKI